MKKAEMVQFQELSIALVDLTEAIVKAKEDGKISMPDVVKVGFSNAESLIKGVAGCDEIPAEIKQGKPEDWVHYVDTVSMSIDSPRAKAIAAKATKAALAMKELYDEIKG
jgi:hypothetical protein